MQEAIRFGLLGLGVGAMYTLGAQGLVVIYRGSGVLNFALGAIGMVGAYVEWELAANHGVPFVPAAAIGVGAAAAIGALVHVVIMRPLRRAAPITRVVATLGVLITLESLGYLRYGDSVNFPANVLPDGQVHLFGQVAVSADRLILLGIAVVITALLWAGYKFTRFGLATGAVAENQRAAATLGWSADAIAAVNWAIGSALAGVAAILIAPIVTLQVSVMTSLVLAALAAALVASFRSFPLTLAAGIALGLAQTELNQYVTQPGLGSAFPFLVIVVVMIVRGQALPLRDYVLQRLPAVGSGRVRPGLVAAAIVLGVVLMGFTSATWITAFITTLATGLILLSIVVLTGYTGQLSLAQFAVAGFGAWVAGRLVATAGVPFLPAAGAGVLAAIPLGVGFALPAVRTRGINLAVVTLGLGSAIEVMLFDNAAYTGSYQGTAVGNPHIFGIDINAITHPTRYGLFTLGCFVVATLGVANIRRGRAGRRLLAVRTNERAAAALGIGVRSAKIYAFAVAAALAALGGILLGFTNNNITYTGFTSFLSISAVGFAVIGGIGYLLGPVAGAVLAPGAVGTQLGSTIFASLPKYIPLIGGVTLIILVLQNQDGVVKETIDQLRWLGRKLHIGVRREQPEDVGSIMTASQAAQTRVAPHQLEVRGLSVAYGKVIAVEDVSLRIEPGRVLGLIGPNGAGKTTLIDAVTGFTQPSSGRVTLDDVDISRWSVARRARAGISRSFQSLELFDDSTVLDNLRVACDPRDRLSYLRDIVWPTVPPLPEYAIAAVREFGLEPFLGDQAQSLSYAQRRLLAIARAVAARPSVLLLDEPAAGLSEQETAELADVVRRLAEELGMGVLVVEHDMSFVMTACDEIVVLDFGHVISQGAPAEVRTDPAVVAAYLGEEYTQAPVTLVSTTGEHDRATP